MKTVWLCKSHDMINYGCDDICVVCGNREAAYKWWKECVETFRKDYERSDDDVEITIDGCEMYAFCEDYFWVDCIITQVVE